MGWVWKACFGWRVGSTGPRRRRIHSSAYLQLIVTGKYASRRARLLRLAALLSWFLPLLCGLWFWRTLTLLGG